MKSFAEKNIIILQREINFIKLRKYVFPTKLFYGLNFLSIIIYEGQNAGAMFLFAGFAVGIRGIRMLSNYYI